MSAGRVRRRPRRTDRRVARDRPAPERALVPDAATTRAPRAAAWSMVQGVDQDPFDPCRRPARRRADVEDASPGRDAAADRASDAGRGRDRVTAGGCIGEDRIAQQRASGADRRRSRPSARDQHPGDERAVGAGVARRPGTRRGATRHVADARGRQAGVVDGDRAVDEADRRARRPGGAQHERRQVDECQRLGERRDGVGDSCRATYAERRAQRWNVTSRTELRTRLGAPYHSSLSERWTVNSASLVARGGPSGEIPGAEDGHLLIKLIGVLLDRLDVEAGPRDQAIRAAMTMTAGRPVRAYRVRA